MAGSTGIAHVTLEVDDPDAAAGFYAAAFDLGDAVRLRRAEAPSSGFRGYSISLVAAQPGDVDRLTASALAAGAVEVKPVQKSFWGYGGVLRAPDGTLWKMVSQSKKDSGPVSGAYDDLVVLLGVDDVKASKAFYVEHGLTAGKSFGGKYAELETGSTVKLSLYPRTAAAKDAGVDQAGSGSHRIVLSGSAGPLTDPDGYVWEPEGNE